MSSANIGDVATWAAAFVALLALLVAIAERRGANRANAENRELARQNADLLKQQHRLEQRAWTDTHFDAVRDWAQQVCFTLADAMHVQQDQRIAVISKLSALVDIGRWYFPNQWSEKYGVDKEPAYRGIRQPVLECLVAAYDDLSDETPGTELRSRLEACQRHFVSQIQLVIDPRSREKQIARILDDWEQAERLRDLPANDEKARTRATSKKAGKP